MMICVLKIYNSKKEFLLEARERPVQVKKHSLKTHGKGTLAPRRELELTTGVVCMRVWVHGMRCHINHWPRWVRKKIKNNRIDQLLSYKLDHQSQNMSWAEKQYFVFFFTSFSDKIIGTQPFMTLTMNWETQITVSKRQKIEVSHSCCFFFGLNDSVAPKEGTFFLNSKL